MTQFCPIKRFDHIEFYVGNARQAALFYSQFFGFKIIAYRGLETGSREVASYVLQQGNIRLVFSSGLKANHPICQFALKHGDGVAVIALEVPSLLRIYQQISAKKVIFVTPPTQEEDETGLFQYAVIPAFGDTYIKFVQRSSYHGIFAPNFFPIPKSQSNHISTEVGLLEIDHIVSNVECGEIADWETFFQQTMGFRRLKHFDSQAISTQYSALISTVIEDSTGQIKIPINEPAPHQKKSQIREYLDYNQGPGIQHIAWRTNNIIDTVSQMRQMGVQFLSVPPNYYYQLEQRIGKIDESIEKLAQLGILVDRDEQGYLLQLFTRPVQDRPTLFFEVIQRQGSQGFGEGNFKSLFEAIEREQLLRGNL